MEALSRWFTMLKFTPVTRNPFSSSNPCFIAYFTNGFGAVAEWGYAAITTSSATKSNGLYCFWLCTGIVAFEPDRCLGCTVFLTVFAYVFFLYCFI